MNLFKLLESNTIFQTHWLTLKDDEVVMPNGSTGHYGYVERHDGIGLIVKDGEYIYLVTQPRYPTNRLFLQLPFERKESDETFDNAASRCAEEELGIKAKNIVHIGESYADSGLSKQKIHFYSAEVDKHLASRSDPSEVLEKKKVKIKDLTDLIMKGKIEETHSVAGIFYFLNS